MNLFETHPHLKDEWSNKNTLDPNRLTHGSNKQAYWICRYKHEWPAMVCDRTKGKGCPICSNKKIVVGVNDLATIYPEIVKEWSDKNRLKPTEVSRAANKVVLWQCAHEHEWRANINDRTRKNSSCPTCSGRTRDTGVNDLATTHPDLARELSPKSLIPATELSAQSSKKMPWICNKGHEWEARIADRSGKETGCPRCWAHARRSKQEIELFNYVKGLFDESI